MNSGEGQVLEVQPIDASRMETYKKGEVCFSAKRRWNELRSKLDISGK